MRKHVLLLIATLFVMISCQDSLNERLDVLENRVEELKELTTRLNGQINSMQKMVTALEDNDFVTGFEPILSPDGAIIGYHLNFKKSGVISIYHGKDGKDSQLKLSVKQAEDGLYYWTINGDYLLNEDGEKVRASALDGKDGQCPQIKIEDGFWYVSYNKGKTWEKLGEVRPGEYTFFDDIQVKEDQIIIVMGDENLILPRKMQAHLQLNVGPETAFFPSSNLQIQYEILHATETTTLMVESNGFYSAQITENDDNTGIITVTCPGYYVDGYINIVLNDGKYSEVHVINFYEGKMKFAEGYEYYLPQQGGSVKVQFQTNFDYKISIPTECDWVKTSDTKAALKEGEIQLIVSGNEGENSRIARIGVYQNDQQIPAKEIILHQSGNKKDSDKAMKLLVEASPKNAYKAYLPLSGAEQIQCTIDWGDGKIETLSPGAELPVFHQYEANQTTHYVVTINGTVTSLNSESLPSHSVTEVIQWGETGLVSLETAFINNDLLTTIHQAGGSSFAQLAHARRVFENCYSLTQLPKDLFADCLNVTDFNSLFWHCENLETLPEGLFKNCSNVTNFDSVFGSCYRLKAIPADLLSTCTSAETVRNLFLQCYSLEQLPADLFKNCQQITSFNAAFNSCKSLKALPAGLFKTCTKAEDYTWTFYGCSALKTLPSGLFNNTTCADFFNTFYNCPQLESLPADLFSTCSASTHFEGVFNTCRALKSLPAGLFSNCTAATNFKEAFRDCDHLSSIPEGLFAKCELANNFEGTFNGCISLTSIPSNFFGTKTGNVNFKETFIFCNALREVAEDLFNGCPATTAFEGTFKNCLSLQKVGDIFKNCKEVLKYKETFRNCTDLTELSPVLFASSPKVTDFYQTFRDCNGLKSLPASLFEQNTEVYTFYQAFANCVSLQALPASLFDACLKAKNFGSTFNNCVALTGESPYTMIEGKKYHLYERVSKPETFAKPSSTRDCFEACLQLTDYYNILSSWR